MDDSVTAPAPAPASSPEPGLAVAVIGARGRMGATVCRAVEAATGLTLVGGFDLGDELGDLGGAQVVVEFSVPSASLANVVACVRQGVHVVVGTTGWEQAALDTVRAELAAAPPARTGGAVGVLIAPNFALGAVLMMQFARQAARFFESVEIVELHHPTKVDAPSGTAARTAGLVAAARAEAGLGPVPDATTSDPAGTRGGRVDGIPVHSVRVRGLVAHQEVILGNVGETLTIRHDSLDRESFMPGVIEGVRRAVDATGIVENEACPVWVGRLAGDPVPNPAEVCETAWVWWDDLTRLAATVPSLLSPWCVLQVP